MCCGTTCRRPARCGGPRSRRRTSTSGTARRCTSRLSGCWPGGRGPGSTRSTSCTAATTATSGCPRAGRRPRRTTACRPGASAPTGSPTPSCGPSRSLAPFRGSGADVVCQQLYYTSCENGLGGYGGYQFNAITPGVSAAVMREVEDRTVYEPPSWLLADPCPDEPGAYPIAFSHGTSEATGAAITARVVFSGTDYSGRPGNYFAHALVTGTPEQD